MEIAREAVRDTQTDPSHAPISSSLPTSVPVIGRMRRQRRRLTGSWPIFFLEAGAENFLFETNSSADHPVQTAEYIKSRKPDAFILVSFAVQPDGIREGNYVADLYRAVLECDAVDAFGLNCMSEHRICGN